jgi:hypothetical protein
MNHTRAKAVIPGQTNVSTPAAIPTRLSFAKTGAALLPVTIATSRELIAPMIAMVGGPERSNGTYVRSAVSGI